MRWYDKFGDDIPYLCPYWTDHGKGHVKRVKQILEEQILRKLRKGITDFEKDILWWAVEFHDIGMANPKTNNNPTHRLPTTKKEIRAIRNRHEELSRDFVLTHWQKLGILNWPTANIVAGLCYSHRQIHYVREVFPDEFWQIGGEQVRVQLLASLLKLGDALDTDFRRTPEIKTIYFNDVPDEDKWHWYACQCIQGVSFIETAICLEALIPPEDFEGDEAKAKKLVKDKTVHIFQEVFPILPFTVKDGLPWVMVEAKFQYKNTKKGERFRAWEKWWFSEINAEDIKYGDMVSIAAELRGRVRPTMTGERDVLNALEEIQRGGYPVPVPLPSTRRSKITPPGTTYYPISSDQCKQSFLKALRKAKKSIELLASDGLTFPDEVRNILKKKLLSKVPVNVSIFLLDPYVLHEVEGQAENLTASGARAKLENAKKMWRDWWVDVLKDQDENKQKKIRDSFQMIFVKSNELGHLNGSAIIDRKTLRLNIHNKGESSSRGMMLQCDNQVNLLPVIEHYVHDMRRFGKRWMPDEESGEEA